MRPILYLLLLAILAILPLTSQAQVRFDRPHPWQWTKPGLDSVRIVNQADTVVNLNLWMYSGQYEFAFYNTLNRTEKSLRLEPKESKYVLVNFYASAWRNYSTVLWMREGTNQDSISLFGHDSAYKPGRDFDFVSKPPTTFEVNDESYVFTAEIRNLLSDSITVSPYWGYQGNKSFKYSTTPNVAFSLAPNETRTIVIKYHADFHPQRDTGIMIFRSSRPGAIRDTISMMALLGKDFTPDITVNNIEFGEQPLGTKPCRTVTYTNRAAYPVALQYLSHNADDTTYFSNLPPMPIWLAPGERFSTQLCHWVPTNYGQFFSSTVAASYIDTVTNFQSFAIVYVHGKSQQCMQSETDTVFFDKVLVGDSVDKIVTVRNITGKERFITRATMLYGASDVTTYIVDTTLPIPVPAGGTADVKVRFKPVNSGWNGEGRNILSLGFDEMSDVYCNFWFLETYGIGINSKDGSVYDLFPDAPKMLIIKAKKPKVVSRFWFTNNLDHDVIVKSVSTEHAPVFRVTSVDRMMPPFSLKPGERFSVELELNTVKNGFYSDSLTIVTENALQAQIFGIAATVDNVTSSVLPKETVSSAASISLFPNPATREVTIDSKSIVRASVEVVDLLGNRVFSGAESELPLRLSELELPAGTYFVRLQGRDVDGTYRHATSRLIIR